ncbi:transposase [Corallococcus sp. AS-1-6]|nr:transposase [Corallococcus sp. AS-1-6]
MPERPSRGADETRWPPLGSPGQPKWHLWALASAHAVVYRVADTRGAEAARQLLKDFSGVLVTDGYAVYAAVAKQRWCPACTRGPSRCARAARVRAGQGPGLPGKPLARADALFGRGPRAPGQQRHREALRGPVVGRKNHYGSRSTGPFTIKLWGRADRARSRSRA